MASAPNESLARDSQPAARMRVLETWQACGHGYTRQHHGVLVFALRLRCIHGLLLERSGDQAKPTDNAKPTPTRPQCVKRHGFFGPCWSGIPVRTKIVCMRQPPPLRTGRAIARADGDQAVDGYQYDIKVIRWCSR